MSDSHFITPANLLWLSWLEVGKPTIWRVVVHVTTGRTIARNQWGAAPYVPAFWPVVPGDVLEVERLGNTRIRVSVLDGKERMDALQWLTEQQGWGD